MASVPRVDDAPKGKTTLPEKSPGANPAGLSHSTLALLDQPFPQDKTWASNLAAHALNAHPLTAPGVLHPGDASAPEEQAQSLCINTDFPLIQTSRSVASIESDTQLRQSASAASLQPLGRTSSFRAALYSTAGSLSPGSTIASPQLAALLDISPLPSPIGTGKDVWKQAISRSRGSSTASRPDQVLLASQPIPVALASPPRRKVYPVLSPPAVDLPTPRDGAEKEASDSRERARSLSEYIPAHAVVPMPRLFAVSGTGPSTEAVAAQSAMHREDYLADKRGLTTRVVKPPTPPRSIDRGYTSGDEGDEPASERAKPEIYIAKSISSGRLKRYKSLRFLGQGTFSKVFLADRQVEGGDDGVDYAVDSTDMDGVRLRSRRLVAVKIVEHGPAGGADAERIEVSLKREVEIMRSVTHPSLVHLKAFGMADGNRALLVMNYSPGGDLFDLASTKLEVLVPSLVRRIFAELVSAVRYLHQKYIVHRDIKLESEKSCPRSQIVANDGQTPS